jgi:hypothetical protein
MLDSISYINERGRVCIRPSQAVKTPPLVMPANLVGQAKKLESDFPGRIGVIFSPDGWRNPRNLPYALDNCRFTVWAKGKEWNESLFWSMIEKTVTISRPPLWLLVPDVVADAGATFREWRSWYPGLSKYSWPLALAVQDGMTPQEVLGIRPVPDVIFIGGTTRWKWRTLTTWTHYFPRVHVGRVNTGRMLWMVHRAGAESSDGTGWWHVRQASQLRKYLEETSC